ncbi:MAG: hypothetical protein ACO3RK_02465 [Luteolibacter sp.]
MKHIGSDTFAAPRIFHMKPGDFAIAAKNLCNDAWRMQQAWLSAPEKNLRAGMVRFGWEPDAFWVLADLHDDFITSRSTDHNQDMWLLGDVFEIFIARKNSPHYLELHVTPHNHRMHLKLTAEDLEKIRSKHATLDEFRCSASAFDSWVLQPSEQNQWQVLARIPSTIFPDGGPFAVGEKLELSFSRYDAGPEGTPDVLSSTSPHLELNYHRRHEWRKVVLQEG